jgi:hypothetical protein
MGTWYGAPPETGPVNLETQLFLLFGGFNFFTPIFLWVYVRYPSLVLCKCTLHETSLDQATHPKPLFIVELKENKGPISTTY